MTTGSPGRTRQIAGLVLGLVISGVCIAFALSRVEWPELLAALGNVDRRWLLVALGVHVLRVFTLVWRWRILMSAQGEGSWKLALESLAVGYAANTLLPLRSGDLARIGGVTRLTGLPSGRVSAALLMERLGDALALAVLATVAVFFLPPGFWDLWRESPDSASRVPLVAGGLVAAAVLGVVAWRWLLPRLLPGVAAWSERFLVELRAGFVTVFTGGRRTGWILLSLATWGLEVVTYFCVLRSAGIPLGLLDSLVVCAVGSLVVMIPSAPGGFGTFELAIQTLLGLYGCSPSLGLAASLLIHTMVLLPITLLGSVWMAGWIREFTAPPR